MFYIPGQISDIFFADISGAVGKLLYLEYKSSYHFCKVFSIDKVFCFLRILRKTRVENIWFYGPFIFGKFSSKRQTVLYRTAACLKLAAMQYVFKSQPRYDPAVIPRFFCVL